MVDLREGCIAGIVCRHGWYGKGKSFAASIPLLGRYGKHAAEKMLTQKTGGMINKVIGPLVNKEVRRTKLEARNEKPVNHWSTSY